MKQYTVRVSPHATSKVAGFAARIAERSGSLEIADRWISHVYRAIATLRNTPRRYGLAEENAHREYEIRCRIVGNYLVLYRVNDEKSMVQILNIRHAAQLPRPGELPDR